MGETPMTPGQLALIEAARLESARVYGGVVRETSQPRWITAVVAEAELEAALQRVTGTPDTHDADLIYDAITDGMTTAQIMDLYGATYTEVRDARKTVMKDGAA